MRRRAERRVDVERQRLQNDPPVTPVLPSTPGQRALADAIRENHLVIAIGPAGTGKTCIAVSAAAMAINAGHVGRIILTRPAVDAGEQLGFLPGDLREKMAPFLRPLYDELQDRVGKKRLARMLDLEDVEIAPVGMMRGRTLKDAFVIVDEAQNLTVAQLKMVLTRIGAGSRMVLTGDPRQADIADTGLAMVARRLAAVPGVAVVELSSGDIVRHPLVIDILAALDHETA